MSRVPLLDVTIMATSTATGKTLMFQTVNNFDKAFIVVCNIQFAFYTRKDRCDCKCNTMEYSNDLKYLTY